MQKKILFNSFKYLIAGFILVHPLKSVYATNLSLGADYRLRGVSIEERDKTQPNKDYYDQQIKAYLITDLSKDVEATLRVQSITPWGFEGSTISLGSRYPSDNGNLWVQNAFIRLPNIWKRRITLTLGRQPLKWGDGEILDDDDLGFNALRAQIKSPWRRIDFDLDVFTAKIEENISSPGDTDLTGIKLRFDRKAVTWQIMTLIEDSNALTPFEAGSDTFSVTSTGLKRTIIGVRARTNVKDAFIKGAYYIQKGDFSFSH